jgi:hypothetical protein
MKRNIVQLSVENCLGPGGGRTEEGKERKGRNKERESNGEGGK